MDMKTRQYFALFYGVLDSTSGELRFVCAAYPGPIYVPHEREPQVLPVAAHAIGWFPESTYTEQTIRLRPGDRLVCHSDGINESLNAAGEQFGQQRIVDLLCACKGLTLDETLARMLRAAKPGTERRLTMTPVR